ncbi:hypothetical protein LIER_31114 [Lithospermum erythrorhizon]|uniref:Retrovirus-related Pol polyprotein from transposon TNT 1-94-like beta-barrel domain-containing protein n=1 Tax=Lithospermum erythrorhizon TaxID=34254 RepID=A0AAV3RRS5_LITER
MGVDFNDEVQALWILGLLPDSWETLSVSLSASVVDGTLTKEMISNKTENKDKKDDQCHYCDKMGHWKSDCYTFKRDVANGTVKNKKSENNVAIVDQDNDLIVVGSDVCYAASDDDWIVDTGASSHVTPHRRFFHTYDKGEFGEVKMENNGVSRIFAIGDIHLKTSLGKDIVLSNVRHIPDFRLSLISLGKLDDDGYLNTFDNGQ